MEKLVQWLKKPLRLVGLGAEPKDSASLPLSNEVQRSLSIICGIDRQKIIPLKSNNAGAIEQLPIDLSNAEVEQGYGSAVGTVALAKPADLLEVYTVYDIFEFTYVRNGVTYHAIPVSTAGNYDFSGGDVFGVQTWLVRGPVTSFTLAAFFGALGCQYYYNAYRFRHGRE